MLQNANVYSAFLGQVRARPQADAIVFPEMTFNFEQMNRLAMAFASRMSSAGVGTNSTLTLQSSEPSVVLATLLAASHLGASIMQDNDGLILPKELSVTHHFHTVEAGRTPAEGSMLIDPEWSPARNSGNFPKTTEQDGDKPWLYVYTSGTTGAPKFIALSQRMVCDRSMAVADDFLPGQTRFASLISCNGRTFIARALAALLNGATIVGCKDLDFWRRAGVTMVSGSVRQMVAFFGVTALNPRLPLAEVIGSRLLKSDARRLLQSFETVQDVFGASEANKIFANVSTLTADGTVETKGQVRDTSVEIVDVDGSPAAPGIDGILRVRNAYMANGYIGDATAGQQAFRDGWFYTGDVASWGLEGTLLIRDRTGNVFNIGGFKINALIVDQIFRSVNGILDAACFKNPKDGAIDELFAFVVFADGCNRIQATEIARQRCRERLGQVLVPRVVRGVAGIPRGPDGTPDRKVCADLILEFARRKSGQGEVHTI
jgi:acyl-coenzyme A synthetase/AMP-(fatty) acid ligase